MASRIKRKKFTSRIIEKDGKVLINICDEEIVGKIVKGEEIEVNISSDYFGGDLLDNDDAVEALHSSSILNLAGKRIIALALKEGVGTKMAVKEIDGTPFLMIYK